MLLTLSSDPRVWMGGGIPTPWRWYRREGGRLSKSAVLHRVIYSKNHCFQILFRRNTSKGSILRPPFYTLSTEGRRQRVVKILLLGRRSGPASTSRSLATSTVPTNCLKGTAQMLVLLDNHDLHKVLVGSRTCAKGFQRALRGRSEALRGRSEDAERRAEALRGRSEVAEGWSRSCSRRSTSLPTREE